MRFNLFSGFAAAVFISLFASIGISAQDAAPSAYFPQTHYEFSPVLDGAVVVHEFVIQNKGTATLNVERVKTG
jgi:hypothetical protein